MIIIIVVIDIVITIVIVLFFCSLLKEALLTLSGFGYCYLLEI